MKLRIMLLMITVSCMLHAGFEIGAGGRYEKKIDPVILSVSSGAIFIPLVSLHADKDNHAVYTDFGFLPGIIYARAEAVPFRLDLGFAGIRPAIAYEYLGIFQEAGESNGFVASTNIDILPARRNTEFSLYAELFRTIGIGYSRVISYSAEFTSYYYSVSGTQPDIDYSANVYKRMYNKMSVYLSLVNEEKLRAFLLYTFVPESKETTFELRVFI